jgi:hypothetical protein
VSLLLVACGGVAAGWSRLAWWLLLFYNASPSLLWRVGALYADVFNRSTAVGRLVGFGFFAGCRLNLFRGSCSGVVAFRVGLGVSSAVCLVVWSRLQVSLACVGLQVGVELWANLRRDVCGSLCCCLRRCLVGLLPSFLGVCL